MAQLNPHAGDKCSVCGQPFYDPEQGSVKDYHYTNRHVSDAHRVMFHSGSERDLNYDPDYAAAIDRQNKRVRDNVARFYAQYEESHSTLARLAKAALDVSRETEV